MPSSTCARCGRPARGVDASDASSASFLESALTPRCMPSRVCMQQGLRQCTRDGLLRSTCVPARALCPVLVWGVSVRMQASSSLCDFWRNARLLFSIYLSTHTNPKPRRYIFSRAPFFAARAASPPFRPMCARARARLCVRARARACSRVYALARVCTRARSRVCARVSIVHTKFDNN